MAPGNGRSSSDQEEADESSQQITDSSHRVTDSSHHQQQSEPSSPSAIRPKKERFGFKFLRLFGSTRKLNRNNSGGDLKKGQNPSESAKIQQNPSESIQNPSSSRRSKSCERAKAESNRVDWTTHARFNLGIRAASSSPSIKTTPKRSINNPADLSQYLSHDSSHLVTDSSHKMTDSLAPSTLSMSTEWEYQEQLKQQQQQQQHLQQPSRPNRFLLNTKAQKNDRKSSGYDSLGCESSSLDSNQDPTVHGPFTPSPTNSKGGVDHTLLLKQKLMQCDESEVDATEEGSYSIPSNGQGLVQYDERDIIRMEQRLRQQSCS